MDTNNTKERRGDTEQSESSLLCMKRRRVEDDDSDHEQPAEVAPNRQPAVAKKFRLSAKSVFLTYPQCKLTKERALSKIKAKRDQKPLYITVAQEKHETEGDHLHALAVYDTKVCYTSPNCFDLYDSEEEILYHGNYQGARKNEDVKKYVQKDKNFIEEGEMHSNAQTLVQKRAIDNKLILNTPLPELVRSGDISIYSYQQLKAAKNLYTLDTIHCPAYMPKTCYWIYGASGIGKSKWSRINSPHKDSLYLKSLNKWWDGYNGETAVLLDDLDHFGSCLGHYLKIWGDCYPFNAEVKGSTIKPVYDTFIITSQYLPKDIWMNGNDETKWDREIVSAITRRFKIMTTHDGGDTIVPYSIYV